MGREKEYACTECGRVGYTHSEIDGTQSSYPRGWKSGGYINGVRGRQFCSSKCLDDYNSRNSSSESSSDSFFSFDDNKSNKSKKSKKEKREEREESARDAEKKAKREAKAEVLKEQGKPMMAFVTVNQEGVGIGVFIALALLPTAFGAGGIIVGIIASVVIGGILGLGIYIYFKEMFKK